VVPLGTNRSSQKASGFVIALEAVKHVAKVVEGCPVQFPPRPTVVVDTIEHREDPPLTTGVFGWLVREEASHDPGSIHGELDHVGWVERRRRADNVFGESDRRCFGQSQEVDRHRVFNVDTAVEIFVDLDILVDIR